MLAPPHWKTVCSYIIGWLTTLAWVATVAIETLFAGTMIQGAIVLDKPNYEAKPWQGTLLTWAVILGCILINVVIPQWLPKFEVFIMTFHLIGFVAILVTLLVMTPSFGSNASVWLTSLNNGGWPTQGLSYCVGFLGNVATFVGADASVHLAEEVSNAAKNIPRAILAAMCINGVVGFAMLITILYCLGDLESVLGTATGFPYMQIFLDSVGNVAGATVMVAVVLILTWACAIGITTTASRMTWSFARDRGLPGSSFLTQVSSRTRVPINAVFTVTIIAALLTLIYIGSPVTFNDIVSLTITGFYGSYFLPAAFLLYRRIKGQILPAGSEPDGPSSLASASASPEIAGAGPSAFDPDKSPVHAADTKAPLPAVLGATEVVNAPLIWGPWHVPGWLGILNNAYACAYMIFVIFFSVWPPATPVTPSTMNYSVVVTGGVMILSAVWYYVRARKVYHGPLIDREVARVMRVGSIVAVE